MYNSNTLYKNIENQLKQYPGYNYIKYILDKFDDLDFYLAGGVIRDNVIGTIKHVKDVDIFVGGKEHIKVIEFLSTQGNILYGPFGSARWFPSDSDYIYYDIVSILKFYNGLWNCFDIIDVLNQFDCTANAMAYNLRDSEFYNPQNGLRDTCNQVVRGVRFDYPDEMISDSCQISRLSILWFRFLHYSSSLNFDIEPVTFQWIKNNAYRIKDLDTFSKYFFMPNLKNKYCKEIFNESYKSIS